PHLTEELRDVGHKALSFRAGTAGASDLERLNYFPRFWPVIATDSALLVTSRSTTRSKRKDFTYASKSDVMQTQSFRLLVSINRYCLADDGWLVRARNG